MIEITEETLPVPHKMRSNRFSAVWLLFVILLIAAPAFCDSVNTSERTVTKLAEGVYEIRHPDSPDSNLNGNTTVIIGEREVLVVDSCFQRSAAREDIAQIRKWTDKPVRYLLNTHFHNDHNVGNGDYAAAFPALAVIAHTDTKTDMYRTATTQSRFASYVSVRKQRIETGKGADGKELSESQKAQTARELAARSLVLEELQGFVYQPPTLTFDTELEINLGNREVQVKHLGRGTTRGDTIVYLPKEKILVAGDLLTHPVLFTYDGYPTDWIQTLEAMGQMDLQVIVPGHGDVLYDKTYLYLSRDLLQSAVGQVTAQLHQLSATVENPRLEDVRKGVDLTTFRQRFAGDDKDTGEAFDDAADHLIKVVYTQAMPM